MIHMVHALNLGVVVTGVESAAHALSAARDGLRPRAGPGVRDAGGGGGRCRRCCPNVRQLLAVGLDRSDLRSPANSGLTGEAAEPLPVPYLLDPSCARSSIRAVQS